MQIEIIISGSGGQGALFAGTILAYAGMERSKYVTWIPSYGPEMRGGTAHVTVIISDQEIGSPLVRRPRAVIALNNPSMEKYEPLVQEAGLLVYNSSLISIVPSRSDIKYVPVPANDIATELGHVKTANMVTLGALVIATKVIPLTAVINALRCHIPENKRELLSANEHALFQGAQCVESIEILNNTGAEP